ncbi:hypothetical protein [Methylobacterium gregans]|uniref:Uncharacterized protein n=1 Tax=Methylobacterium gregans TaxID=374424 RepID=A0AA37HN70_9HYPH|nr:hypothetical protein [Methylobacterium gregans]MDQ0520299.1 hypothetical protein [Methylobacterium gregans]GJD78506.1 hypothetical protein NBEOAGPD_1722 [Methylobacterium gregans]
MLLDPSSSDLDVPDEANASSAPFVPRRRRRRRPRKLPLSRTEEAQADARTISILEDYGIDFRPAQETILVAVATGTAYLVNETRERPLFATLARRRAAAMALSFDAFAQGRDLSHLRLVGLRPAKCKARPGTLAQALSDFARVYDRRVGRLVTAGMIKPVLSVVHIRYDVAHDLWDIHAHALWDVRDDKVEAALMDLGVKFFDKWIDEDKVERPGAAANYCASRVIDHREIMAWPEEAILELWNLPRVRLMKPAGEFRRFRGTLKGKVVRREGNRIVIEDRPDPGPRRKASKRPGQTMEAGRVVAMTKARVPGGKTLCAVVKRPRTENRADGIEGSPAASSRAREDLASGEYRHNSPPANPTPRDLLSPGSLAPNVSPASRPVRAARKATKVLPPRKAWMVKAWPPGPIGRLPRAIARRLPEPSCKVRAVHSFPVSAEPVQDRTRLPPSATPSLNPLANTEWAPSGNRPLWSRSFGEAVREPESPRPDQISVKVRSGCTHGCKEATDFG